MARALIPGIRGVVPFEADGQTPRTTSLPFAAGEAHLGEVGGYTPRVSAQMVRAANADGAYAAGDGITQNNTGTPAITPIEFTIARKLGGSGLIPSCRCVLTAGSGTIVIANCAFDLLLFRPETDIPFAAGSYPNDNAAMNISAAAMKQIVGIFSFTAGGWRNQAGANAAAGDHVYQAVSLSTRSVAPFNLASLTTPSQKLLGLVQARDVWNPGNVAQTFDFLLDTLGD